MVITSPLRRAAETAELVADHRTPVERTRLARERGFGVMEGLTWDEVRALDPPVLFIEVGDDLHSVNPQGGEPFEDVWQRARRLKSRILRRHREERVLVVSHGVFLQMFHGVLRGLSCIESLTTYPANLELATFTLQGDRLIQEEVERLRDAAGLDF